MCQTCQNVVLSYGRSRAAAQYVDNFWLSAIKPVAPNFSLFETDPVKIEPYRAGASSMKAKAATALIGQLQQLDFRVEESVRGNVFLIELKTGPGNPKEMKGFQLDVNDVQDISTAMEILRLPAYVFHVQIENEYRGATRRPVARNLWWADLTTFLAAESSRAERRDERKQAIYFDPSVFQAKESFVEELLERRFEDGPALLSQACVVHKHVSPSIGILVATRGKLRQRIQETATRAESAHPARAGPLDGLCSRRQTDSR